MHSEFNLDVSGSTSHHLAVVRLRLLLRLNHKPVLLLLPIESLVSIVLLVVLRAQVSHLHLLVQRVLPVRLEWPVEVDQRVDVQVEQAEEEQEDPSLLVVDLVDAQEHRGHADRHHKETVEEHGPRPGRDLAEVAQGKDYSVDEHYQVEKH